MHVLWNNSGKHTLPRNQRDLAAKTEDGGRGELSVTLGYFILSVKSDCISYQTDKECMQGITIFWQNDFA